MPHGCMRAVLTARRSPHRKIMVIVTPMPQVVLALRGSPRFRSVGCMLGAVALLWGFLWSVYMWLSLDRGLFQINLPCIHISWSWCTSMRGQDLHSPAPCLVHCICMGYRSLPFGKESQSRCVLHCFCVWMDILRLHDEDLWLQDPSPPPSVPPSLPPSVPPSLLPPSTCLLTGVYTFVYVYIYICTYMYGHMYAYIYIQMPCMCVCI